MYTLLKILLCNCMIFCQLNFKMSLKSLKFSKIEPLLGQSHGIRSGHQARTRFYTLDTSFWICLAVAAVA